ncbi:MAG: hypothetical protein ABI895_41160 [Deltaproteobacteria bacterium]
MTIAEPNDRTRPSAPDDVEPLWYVRLPAGMASMTLDELDAAFQQGSITRQTLVAREGERYLRPLGVVAGLSGQIQLEAFCSEAPRGRASDVTGVRPSVYTRCQRAERAQPDSFTPTLLGISTWESAAVRWLRNTRSALGVTTRQGTSWLLVRAPRQRWALGGVLLVSVAALVCVSWQVLTRSRNVLGTAPPQPRSPVAASAPPSSQRESLVALGTAPVSAASMPLRAVELSADLDVPITKDTQRHGLALAERRKAALSDGTKRPSRKARASRRRRSHE